MSAVLDLLSTLRKLDVKLSLESGKLKINAPKGVLNDELKEALRLHKEDVISFLDKAQKGSGAELESIPRVDRSSDVAATESQARFWFLEKFNPGQPLFNIPLPIEIRGEIDIEKLRLSVEHLVHRHENLRSYFEEADGVPYIRINEQGPWHLPIENIPYQDEAALKQRVQKEISQPFDLANGPLMRVKLLEVALDPADKDRRPHYILLNCIHHIICDGWSMDILLREIISIYASLSSGAPVNLSPLEIDFFDFAAWQNARYGQQEDSEENPLLTYWQQQLKGAQSLLPFPYDRTRPLVPSSAGSSMDFTLGKKLSAGLKRFCRDKSMTPFMVLMAAYQLTLAKYCESQDISVGIPIAGRTRADIEGIMGLFLNALVIRSRSNSSQSIEDYLSQMKTVVLEAFDHQDLPLERLISTLDIDREKEEVPGVQFGFILQNTSGMGSSEALPSIDTDNLSVRALNFASETSKHDICLTLGESGDDFKASIEYKTALLDESSVETFFARFQSMLEAILQSGNQDQSIGDIALYSHEEISVHLGVNSDDYEAILPLTLTQEGFYLNDLIHGESQSTLIGYHLLLQGDLNIDLLKKALETLVAQRRVLRTEVIQNDPAGIFSDIAYQCVRKQTEIDFQILNVENLSLEEAEEKAKALIYTPFQLHGSLLVCYRLLKLADDKYLLVVPMHHMMLDAVSGLQHWIDTQNIYEASLAGEKFELAEDNYLQYINFAREQLDSPEVLEYWSEALAGVVSPDYFVHSLGSLNDGHEQGERIFRRELLPLDEWADVKKYCRKKGITPAIFYKVLFSYLVESYTRPENDFYINEVVTGRSAEFSLTHANCFLMQPFISKDNSKNKAILVDDLFAEAKRQQKAIRGKAFLSQQSREKLAPQGRVGFYYNFLQFVKLSDFSGRSVQFRDWGNEIDNAVEFNPRIGHDGLELNLFYREGLFREQGFLKSLRYITQQLIAGEEDLRKINFYPDISDGAFLTKAALAEQEALGSSASKDLSLAHHISAVAKEHGSKNAVSMAGDALTYVELNKRANQIANYLKQEIESTTKPTVVAVKIPKSIDTVVSILGVLKAGFAYLPIDTSTPEDRQTGIIESSGAALVLDGSEAQKANIANHAEDFDLPTIDLDDLAYLIYTSGSTGEPKGVMVSHRACLGTYFGWEADFDLSADDQHLQMASVGFDVFSGDLIRALCSGACLHLVDKESLMTPSVLLDLIESKKITIAEFVPAVLRTVVQEKLSYMQGQAHRQDAIAMRMLIVGSDAWYEQDQINLQMVVKAGTRLVNSYGVTEACIDSSFSEELSEGYDKAKAHEGSASQDEMSSIGKPFPNTQLSVRDEFGNILPCEVPGELCIGGPDIADGYFNDEKLSAEVFVKDLYFDESKIYRSGDKAKILSDGNIILLGRIGEQIKIRGFRIELGEVESQLSALPEIKEAVVLAQNLEDSHEKHLAAYIVYDSKDVPQLKSSELRLKLNQKLPDYMLPHAYQVLDHFPLSSNGKIDRNALEPIDFSQVTSAAYVAPRNEVENKLCEIWQEVLGQEKIGVYDNFFDLGGHSLLATQVISRISQNFAKDIPLKEIFANPSVAHLAEQIEINFKQGDFLKAPEMQPVARQDRHELSYAQRRFWFLDRLVPGFYAYNMPFAVRIKGGLDSESLSKVFSELSQRHEILRTTFPSEDSQPYACVKDYEPWQLNTLVKETGLSEAELVEKLTLENARKPFDLSKDNLLRTSIYEFAEDDHLLLICMHHIIADGWSIRLLLREIAILYSAFTQRVSSPLAANTLQYIDYAAWEQNWLQGDVLETYTDYWLRHLEGAPEILRLPCDKPRPQVQTFNGKQIKSSVDQALLQKLERFSQDNNASLFMTLIAAMSLLMSRYAKEKDVLIGTPVAGRNNLATESMVGLFLNALIIRTQLEGNPTITELMAQVRETCLDAFAHQDMPAEILFDRLAKHRDPQYPPGAQVGLVLQNTQTQQNEIRREDFGEQFAAMGAELSAELLGNEQTISNYDFGLTIVELGKSLDVIAEFNTDLFFDETIESMLQQYVSILEQMCEQPALGIDHIKLTKDEDLLSTLGFDKDRIEQVLPLTAMQQGMYYANRINPLSKEYSLGFTVRMNTELDPELWNKALQSIIDCQSVARLSFKESKLPYLDEVYQVIDKQGQAKVKYEDWSDREASEEEIENHCSEFINAPYDLLKDDLTRVMLLKIRDDYFVGVFGSHHILLDGIAVVAFGVMGAVNYEIMYNDGDPIVHPDKYGEYIEQECLATDSSETRKFWQANLVGLEALNYPVHQENLMVSAKAKQSLMLSPEHWLAVKTYCKQNRVTPAIYFKALYGFVLGRFCRADSDYYISEILAARPKGHLNALGCYFQQIPTIFDDAVYSEGATFTALLKSLRAHQKKSKGKQGVSVPFQTALLPPARLSFMYNFENYIPDFVFMGEQVAIQEYSNQVNGIVQLLVKTLSDRAQLNLQFQEGYFDDFQLLDRMLSISEQILAGEDELASLSVVNEAEKNTQISIFNDNDKDYDEGLWPHKAFEKQVQITPDNLALKWANKELTYQALNEQSNSLAHLLIEKGLEPGDLVGVCLEMNADLLIVILAVLKAGGAYLPMDSQYPKERLSYFIEDSKPKFTISEKRLNKRLPDMGTNCLWVEDLYKELSSGGAVNSNPDISLNQDALIYVLYTSGSTGKPNCTAAYQRSEANLIQWYGRDCGMSGADKVLVISALGFDLTQKNFFAPLSVGASVHFPEQKIYDPSALVDYINDESVSWINCAPSAFYPLVEEHSVGDRPNLESVRKVFLGGEPIQYERIASWHQGSQSELYNSYGPSECTDISAYYLLDKNKQNESIPIGKANPNIKLYILDNGLSLLPEGLPGDLYVGGAGVGAGYLNNDTLNARKFFDNPYGKGKIYRTGDIAKYCSPNDSACEFEESLVGQLTYIGREDFQVKLRGVRVELGEIQALINQFKEVSDSVLVIDNSTAHEYLVAYIELERFDKNLLASFKERLINHLLLNLPEFMRPDHYEFLEKLPLSPNGKIDRSALPLPQYESDKDFVEPINDLEKQLAKVWEEVLGVNKVGRYDNFFEVGGNSLNAVQVISKLNQSLKLDLPLAVLFEAQSLDLLAIKVGQYDPGKWQQILPLRLSEKEQSENINLFFIHPIGGEVLCYRDLAKLLDSSISVFGIQAQGLVSGQEVIEDLENLVEKYITEIRTKQPAGPYYLGGQSLGGVYALAIANALKQKGEEVPLVTMFDSFVPNKENLQALSVSHLRSSLAAFIQVDETEIHEMAELDQLRVLFDAAKEAYLLPQDLDFVQVEKRYGLAKANIAMLQAVDFGSYSGAVRHFEAETSLSGRSSKEGWREYLEGFETELISGNHESIMDAENVVEIAKSIDSFVLKKGN